MIFLPCKVAKNSLVQLLRNVIFYFRVCCNCIRGPSFKVPPPCARILAIRGCRLGFNTLLLPIPRACHGYDGELRWGISACASQVPLRLGTAAAARGRRRYRDAALALRSSCECCQVRWGWCIPVCTLQPPQSAATALRHSLHCRVNARRRKIPATQPCVC